MVVKVVNFQGDNAQEEACDFMETFLNSEIATGVILQICQTMVKGASSPVFMSPNTIQEPVVTVYYTVE